MTRFDEDSAPGSLLPDSDAEVTILLAAFEGWNDAGEAASAALRQLADTLGASAEASMDADDYYDFQFTRPIISRRDGEDGIITWPNTRFASVRVGRLRIVFAHGIEPSYRWQAYTEEFLEYAQDYGVDCVLLAGALLADVPHSRPIPVTGTSEDAAIRARLGLEKSQYGGPVGIVGVLSEALASRDIPAFSLWAAVPHYVSQAPSPKAQLALLHKIEEYLQIPLDVTELTEDAEAWERGVDELATDDPEIAQYVHQLEEAKDTVELPEASGESIAREFERYLRRRGKDKP